MTNGGKGSARRREDTAAVEANWPSKWDARDVPKVHGTTSQDGPAHGAGDVQQDAGQGVPTGS